MSTDILLNKLLAHLYTLYPYASMYFLRCIWSKMNCKYTVVGTFVTLGLQLDEHMVCNCSNVLHIQ